MAGKGPSGRVDWGQGVGGGKQEGEEEGQTDSLTHPAPYVLVIQEARDTACFVPPWKGEEKKPRVGGEATL